MTEFVHFFVEEPSAEAFLEHILPGILDGIDFRINRFLCKDDLLLKIGDRLRGLASWIPPSHKVVVLLDRDDDDAAVLVAKLDKFATDAGLTVGKGRLSAQCQVVNRLAIEELEAWFFGELDALRACYPRVPATLLSREGFRNPDSIMGGTWEAMERVLQKAGYFQGGLAKIELARNMGTHFRPERCISTSFKRFYEALLAVSLSPGKSVL